MKRTFTHADLEQMANATAASTPVPEDVQKVFAPAWRAALAALADGRPASVDELAAAAGQNPKETDAILAALARAGLERDVEGRVTGLGITLNPTPHRVDTGGHRLYAVCAADALGTLPAIGRTVRVSSDCPATGQTVTVTVDPDGIRDVQPPEAVMSAIISGDPDNMRATVCNLGNFFTSADAASGWAKQHPDGVVLTIPDAFHYVRSLMRLLLDV